MAVIRRTRGAQYPLVAEYVFNYNDGQANLSALNGASVESNPKANVTDFGSQVQPTGLMSGITYVASTAGTYYFEVVTLPINAQIIGGDLQVEVAYVGPVTATLALGDSTNGSLYLGATNIKATGRTALTIPAELTNSASTVGTDAAAGLDVRATLVLGAGAASAGRVRVRLMYTLDGRMNEAATQ